MFDLHFKSLTLHMATGKAYHNFFKDGKDSFFGLIPGN
jgi:hypothetical protein